MAQHQSKPGAQVGWAARRSKPRPSPGSGTPEAKPQGPHALTLSPAFTSRPSPGCPAHAAAGDEGGLPGTPV